MEEELFGAYCKMADRFPLLNAKEEKELAKRVASGDKSAVEKLVNSNLKLVICIARKFSASADCIMDIIQEGSLGLLNAAEKYNENFNKQADEMSKKNEYERALADLNKLLIERGLTPFLN